MDLAIYLPVFATLLCRWKCWGTTSPNYKNKVSESAFYIESKLTSSLLKIKRTYRERKNVLNGCYGVKIINLLFQVKISLLN